MTTTQIDKTLVDVFAAVFYVGNDMKVAEDVLPVLRLIRSQRPAASQLAVVEAQKLLECGDVLAGRQVLEETDAAQPGSPIVKAMLAMALYSLGDPLWEGYLQEVRRLPPDERALALVACLEKFARGDRGQHDDEVDTGLPAEPAAASVATAFMPYMGMAC